MAMTRTENFQRLKNITERAKMRTQLKKVQLALVNVAIVADTLKTPAHKVLNDALDELDLALNPRGA